MTTITKKAGRNGEEMVFVNGREILEGLWFQYIVRLRGYGWALRNRDGVILMLYGHSDTWRIEEDGHPNRSFKSAVKALRYAAEVEGVAA